jgi:hypothetical protein
MNAPLPRRLPTAYYHYDRRVPQFASRQIRIVRAPWRAAPRWCERMPPTWRAGLTAQSEDHNPPAASLNDQAQIGPMYSFGAMP